MIWKFDFSRRSLVWLLGLSFVAGTGLEIWEQWSGRRAVSSAGIVSMGHDARLAELADSLYKARQVELAKPIDINLASASELERLPGIGPVLAERILSERETNGPFVTVDDLDRVSGIGVKKLAELRARVTVATE
ncbi:MAG: helix-hairpin-helix domain-containing protein [bacterium]|nr:helix-hairpin-helix domain-containing protein [bacterium]